MTRKPQSKEHRRKISEANSFGRRIRKLTPDNIKEAIKLKKQGWSFPQLAKRYGVDHTTIIYHFKRLKITDYPRLNGYSDRLKIKIKPIIQPPPKAEMTKIGNRLLKRTKQYQDYLKAQEEKDNPDPIEKAKSLTHK